jgi:aryl-alcohol dehydrogenase-like predicted oxidoreductase
MSTFTLGHLQVRRSGYGAMQLADAYAFGPPPDRASAIGVLRAAVAARVDHIDTAQYHGVVNDLIREALYPYAVTCLPGELNHPGFRGDSEPTRGWSHASTTEVSG